MFSLVGFDPGVHGKGIQMWEMLLLLTAGSKCKRWRNQLQETQGGRVLEEWGSQGGTHLHFEGGSPAPSLSTIKEDISAFSNLEKTPFPRTFGPKKTPFSFKMRSFLARNLPLFLENADLDLSCPNVLFI